jgi:hypothetical protein
MDAISEPNVTAGEPMSINELPDDILLQILSYFGLEDLCFIIAEVCKRWSDILKYKTLWTTLSYSCDRTADFSHVVQVRCAALLGFRTNVSLRVMAEVFSKCLSTVRLVTDAFIRTVINLYFICFPLHPHSTAGKTVVYSSVILC